MTREPEQNDAHEDEPKAETSPRKEPFKFKRSKSVYSRFGDFALPNQESVDLQDSSSAGEEDEQVNDNEETNANEANVTDKPEEEADSTYDSLAASTVNNINNNNDSAAVNPPMIRIDLERVVRKISAQMINKVDNDEANQDFDDEDETLGPEVTYKKDSGYGSQGLLKVGKVSWKLFH